MTKALDYARQTTSAPTEGQDSGAGSIMAAMLSRGFVATRYTAEGSYRPFGLTIDSADDASLIAVEPFIPPSD